MTKRIVVDTNVHISFLLGKPDTAASRALEMVYERYEAVCSPETLAELETVLHRPKFDRWITDDIRAAYLESVEAHTLPFVPESEIDICSDPDDNMLFALAEAAGAQFILSGDKKHVLKVGEYNGIYTISPDDFLSADNLDLYFGHQAAVRRESGIYVPERLN